MRTFALIIGLVAFGGWPSVAARVNPSLVRITMASGYCTGVSTDRKKGYVVTAAHCDEGEEMQASGLPVTLVERFEAEDLEVLQVKGLDAPALRLGKAPRVGDQVMSTGFGEGLEVPLFRWSRVSGLSVEFVNEIPGEVFLVLDAPILGGMSGGPVVNKAGEVIGFIQRSSHFETLGATNAVLREKTGKYWERK